MRKIKLFAALLLTVLVALLATFSAYAYAAYHGNWPGRHLHDEELPHDPETVRAKEPLSPPSPMYWISARADHWEFVRVGNEDHILAVWNEPYGFDPHFHGWGGDRVTCCSTHGCIGNWVWWLRYPQSKLGVPKSFYNYCGLLFGSQNIYNYSATVWNN